MKPTLTQEAKDALIEALKQSAELFDGVQPFSVGCKAGAESAISIVESFPVSYGWIPVSERLPDNFEIIIATDGMIVVPCHYINKIFYFHGSPAQLYLVSAWQPIPEPPTSE